MKKLFFLISTIILLLINIVSFAQVYAPPEGINYQAVARDTAGKPISSSINLVVRFTIWPDNSGTGTSVFTETHSPVNTNRYGLFTLVIGSANSTDFQNIVWPLGDKFLEVEIATVGGGSYTSMGINQLMSSPYALHSKTSLYSYGNWSVDGNNSTNTADFIGTTNSQDLVIKTNNTEKMRVKAAGNVGLGTSTPLSMLDVAGGFSVGSAYSGVTAAPANGAIIEGNVGIGTSSPDPAAMLDLGGQIKITGGNPGANKVLTSNSTGLATWAIPDTGSVISFSADSLAPLFKTTVTNASIAPALSFTLSDAAPYTILGNGTSGNATPAYYKPILESPLFENQGTALNRVLHSNPSGNLTWGKIDNNDISNNAVNLTTKVTAVLPIANGGTNTNTLGSAGSIPYSNATSFGFSLAGTSGQVLTSSGTGAPTWITPTAGTVTSVTGITPIFSTGGSTPAISVANNSQASPGVVTAGGSNFNKVWKTDGAGAPAWRNDSIIILSAGTGLSLSGTTVNSVWTQLGANIYNNNTSNVGIGVSVPTSKLHITPAGAAIGLTSSTLLGTGSLGVFENFNASNSSSTLVGRTNGSGNAIFATNTGTWRAGTFTISNAANINDALYAETNGTGNAIYGRNTSTGRAGAFQVLNAASTADALYVSTNGSSSKGLNVSHTGAVAGSTNYGAYISNSGAGTAATNIAGYFTATGGAINYAGIFDQGNVGIGTIAPSTQFHTTGGVRFQSLTGTGVRIVLTDASGNLMPGTAPGAGGTLNYVAKFTPDGFTLGNSSIFDNGTSVGIGTIAPAQKLTINYTGGGIAPFLIASPGGAGNTFSVTSDHRLLYSPTVTGAGITLVNFGSNLSTVTTSGSFMTINPLSVDASSNLLNILEGGSSRLIVNGDGNVGIGTTTPTTNARLAINDGHLQSQQTTKPGTGALNTSAQSLTNATDVAGNISFTPSGTTGGVTVAFSMSYAIAPIVIIAPTNSVSATDTPYVWVTSSVSGFIINFSSVFISLSSHTYSYHVIETVTN